MLLARRKTTRGRWGHLRVPLLLLLVIISIHLINSRHFNALDSNSDVSLLHKPQDENPPKQKPTLDQNPDFPLEWMTNIYQSMFHFKKNENISISSFGLNGAYESLRHGLFIRVENNSVYAKSKTVYQTPWTTSFENGVPDKFFCRMYYVMCSLDPGIDVDFVYSHADEPVGDVNNPYPAFSWVKSDTSTDILMPYGEAWGGNMKSNDDLCTLKHSIDDNEWRQKIDKGVWRGANTGVKAGEDWKSSPRAQLVMHCKTHPDLCDAGITQYVNGNMNQIQQMKNLLGVVDVLSTAEQDKFKYAIVPDGNSAPSSRMKTHLESTSLTMKQSSRFKEFFYDSLVPFVHYIPLEPDFRDLSEKIRWMRDNDDLAHNIMQSARRFSCKWFNKNTIHAYMLRVFNEYVNRFQGIKATKIKTSDMIRVKVNNLEDLERECGISPEEFDDRSCKILTEF